MHNQIINTSPTPNAAAETPQPQTALTADATIEQIRSIRAQLPEVATLTSKQRKALQRTFPASAPIVQASLNVIGVSGIVSSAIGQPLDGVRTLQQEAMLWKAVEEEARNLVAGIAGANLLRRQKLAEIGAQAYAVAASAARVPVNEVLVSHVEEIKRLKKIARRKKSATPVPQQPSPVPSTPMPGAPTTGAQHAESKS
jgi:hypothetical protein